MALQSEATIYLDRPVQPNNSLSRRGMLLVLGVLAAFNLLTAVFMIIIGAYPAPIFLGLDMAAVGLAFFLIDRRRAQKLERIKVSTDRVEVYRAVRGRPETIWTTATGFTRVILDQADDDLPVISLASAGRFLCVGTDLGGEGRRQLAAEIEAAIWAARRERYSG